MTYRLEYVAALLLLLTITAGSNRKTKGDISSGKQIVLQIKSDPENPRNSEGDFIQLKDGRIKLCWVIG